MFHSQKGKRVPHGIFHTRQDDQWVDLSTDELFSHKAIIVFSLPGAFTPTCSSSHLPRYNELEGLFAQQGVDSIVCLSVNDAFVMNAWQADQHADHIQFIPDGNGEFTRGMGMLVEKAALGFGPRSWRYSMLVRNGVVEKMFIEPDKSGDPFEVSDADTMLCYLTPGCQVQPSVSLFTKPGCPFCTRAKQMLVERGMPFEEILLGKDATSVSLRAVTGRATVPQVFIGGKHIGGSEELAAFLEQA